MGVAINPQPLMFGIQKFQISMIVIVNLSSLLHVTIFPLPKVLLVPGNEDVHKMIFRAI